jgi:hypothetical protein
MVIRMMNDAEDGEDGSGYCSKAAGKQRFG